MKAMRLVCALITIGMALYLPLLDFIICALITPFIYIALDVCGDDDE